MLKKYLYFQPQYVREFKCDGAKCDARCCCKGWNIEVDAQTRAQYSRIKPVAAAQEILSHIKFNANTEKYSIDMGTTKICPFLTDEKLCRLQRDYGENFLSLTCMTYPRFTWNFGKFFERSMTLTCPVAAEMILFRDEPLSFELFENVKNDQAKVGMMMPPVPPEFAAHFVDVQIAMISILQERTLTLDQRLIVLGFFVDRLDEIISDDLDLDALTKLIAAYESKSFLSTQVPRMLATVNFDAKKFVGRMLTLLEKIFGSGVNVKAKKFFDALVETLEIVPDAQGQVSATKIAANYERLADAREKFFARYATLLENFLVNELFMTCFPWRNETAFAKNFGVFVATYKLFELLTFAAVQKNLCGKDELLQLVDWIAGQMNHTLVVVNNLLKQFAADDIFSTLETFLEAT